MQPFACSLICTEREQFWMWEIWIYLLDAERQRQLLLHTRMDLGLFCLVLFPSVAVCHLFESEAPHHYILFLFVPLMLMILLSTQWKEEEKRFTTNWPTSAVDLCNPHCTKRYSSVLRAMCPPEKQMHCFRYKYSWSKSLTVVWAFRKLALLS